MNSQGAMGWGAITGHAFFAEHSVDLEAMLLRQVEAPFTPEISNALDMSGFEDSDVDLSLPEKIPAFPGDQSPFADFGSTLATNDIRGRSSREPAKKRETTSDAKANEAQRASNESALENTYSLESLEKSGVRPVPETQWPSRAPFL